MKQDKIQTIAIIGLGALGINFAHYIVSHAPDVEVRIVADRSRIKRYQKDGVYYNGKVCDFHYVSDDMECAPVDLALFCTKFHGLSDAIQSMKHQINEHTLIMSAINGISSEEILAKTFPAHNVIYTVAQGMDATKVDNQVTCTNMGELCFGDVLDGKQQAQIDRIDAFFQSISFPHTIKADIVHHQWGKFMLNVGLNQVVGLHRGTYATVQKQGLAREQMIAAMREVIVVSQAYGTNLQEGELQEWLNMTDSLSPDGKPSMAQDIDASRKTEVELFAGTILSLAKQYQIAVPINEMLYRELTLIEQSYN